MISTQANSGQAVPVTKGYPLGMAEGRITRCKVKQTLPTRARVTRVDVFLNMDKQVETLILTL